MRIVALVLFSIAGAGGGVAIAQSASPPERADNSLQQEAPDEVVVRGRRLGELRDDVDMARDRAYDIFNDINSDDDFDVYCREEGRTGTRSTQRVCRAQFESRISADAAQEYMSSLSWRCPAELPGQDCMFSDYSSAAISAAQGIEGQAPSKRDRMKEEILRLANRDERFAQAIIDWYEANQQYEAARKRRNDD
jgi:hypothetical protein